MKIKEKIMTKDGEIELTFTDKEKAFVDYYIISGNGTESAVKAGYSASTASVQASKLLRKPNVLAYIEARTAKSVSERIANGNEVLEFLTSTMRGEIRDQFDLDASISDRLKASEMLAKRYGLLREKIEVSADVDKEKALSALQDIADQMTKKPDD